MFHFKKRLPTNLKHYKYYFSAVIYFVLTYFGYKFVFSVFDSVLIGGEEVEKKLKEVEEEKKNN